MRFFKRHRTVRGAAAILGIAACMALAGCGSSGKKASGTTTVRIWHVYGGQTDSPLNDMIAEFNNTAGKSLGIEVQVTMVTNTNTIHDAVLASAGGEPGAAELPDMFISYPKTVLAMEDDSILVDYRDYFSDDELSEFVPEFLEEGDIGGRLLVLPVAKSTEIMFINKTAFDRFSAESGITEDDLRTWDGLFRAAEVYTEWTDAQTPDVPDDGKPFFVHDYHFNYAQVGVESLGTPFFSNGNIDFSDSLTRVWKPYAEAACAGGVWLQGGYATEPLRTGDSIVSVASSASVLYYSDVVTYPDNTSEEIEIVSRPCPVFAEGEKLVMQRGAGVCTVKSTPEREQAAMEFLRWLTDAERNVDFVTRLGYMPVKTASFEEFLPAAVEKLEDPKYRDLYRAFLGMQKDYRFYTAPQFPEYLGLETTFEEAVRVELASARNRYLQQERTRENLEAAAMDALERLRAYYK